MVINANEIMTLLGVSKSSAYRIINELNESLAKKGFRTIHGKTSRKYFCEEYYLPHQKGNHNYVNLQR